jgi:ribosomal protein S18 acetylase RimI-like enzyme
VSEAAGVRFQSLAEDGDPLRWIPQVLPWVWEAGEPYHSWFFKGIAPAERPDRILAGWMRRGSSEVSVERAVVLGTADRVIGGFVALTGTDLQACRRADTLAALEAAGRAGRNLLAERIRVGQHLFAPIAADEFYLSKLGVASRFRRAGHGARILREYVGTGLERGFRRFRLDVWAENRPAVELYRTFGFQVVREASDGRAGMTYMSMALERGQADGSGADVSGRAPQYRR